MNKIKVVELGKDWVEETIFTERASGMYSMKQLGKRISTKIRARYKGVEDLVGMDKERFDVVIAGILEDTFLMYMEDNCIGPLRSLRHDVNSIVSKFMLIMELDKEYIPKTHMAILNTLLSAYYTVLINDGQFDPYLPDLFDTDMKGLVKEWLSSAYILRWPRENSRCELEVIYSESIGFKVPESEDVCRSIIETYLKLGVNRVKSIEAFKIKDPVLLTDYCFKPEALKAVNYTRPFPVFLTPEVRIYKVNYVLKEEADSVGSINHEIYYYSEVRGTRLVDNYGTSLIKDWISKGTDYNYKDVYDNSVNALCTEAARVFLKYECNIAKVIEDLATENIRLFVEGLKQKENEHEDE